MCLELSDEKMNKNSQSDQNFGTGATEYFYNNKKIMKQSTKGTDEHKILIP